MPNEEAKFEISPEAMAQIAKIAEDEPEAADSLRDMLARMRQAHTDWLAGKYPSMEDAMEAIVGARPVRLSDDE